MDDPEITQSEAAQPAGLPAVACSLCGGKGYYKYDHNHAKTCERCCPHAAGWWVLTEHHHGYAKGADNGCCRSGCGQLRRELHQANTESSNRLSDE